MSESYSNTAIVFESLRDALLYYDYIIPVNITVDLIEPLSEDPPGPVPRLNNSMMPPNLRGNKAFTEDLAAVNVRSADLILGRLAEELETRFGKTPVWHSPTSTPAEVLSTATEAFLGFVDKYNLRSCPLDCGSDLFEDADSTAREATVVSLPSLHLVDVGKCSWEQILELRKDKEATSRLRRLRLFAYDNYSGKTAEYVSDDIMCKVEEYNGAVKKWGLETTSGVIETLVRSKALGGAAAGSLTSFLLGSPAGVAAAAMGGGLVALGQVVCEVSKRKFALDELRREHPVSFISYARDKLRDTR